MCVARDAAGGDGVKIVPLTCRHVRQLHDGYVDGELSPSMNAEVHAHLLQCPECQRQVELVRACGDVIAQDRSETELDSGFASRVLAAMPPVAKRAASAPAVFFGDGPIETRRGRRRRVLRKFVGAAMPVAAAIAFFCCVVWPPIHTGARRTYVAGENAVADELLSPGMVDSVKSFGHTLGHTRQILGERARDGLSDGLNRVRDSSHPEADREPSILDFLLPSLGELVEPAKRPPAPKSPDGDIIRF